MYSASWSEYLGIRGLRYHVRQWGRRGAPKLFLLHGWMDMSASFQFLVDALQQDWHILAPDWRGFGESAWPAHEGQSDCYWFPDYLGDLDALLTHYSAEQAANLVGHSMGGNILSLYAGIRPERVAGMILLDCYGMAETQPIQAPVRYATWLSQLREVPTLQTYSNLERVALRLRKNNPRLTEERAHFLAGHWARQNAQGQWVLRADPAHKKIFPTLYQLPEAQVCWQCVTAATLHVEASETSLFASMNRNQAPALPVKTRDDYLQRWRAIPGCQFVRVEQAGHMLHHDQPESVAQRIEAFLMAHSAPSQGYL